MSEVSFCRRKQGIIWKKYWIKKKQKTDETFSDLNKHVRTEIESAH